MKRPVLTLLALMIAATAALPAAIEACGDKFMLSGRGMLFGDAYVAKYPGAVLMYVPSGPSATAYGKVFATLTRAGHKVTQVSDPRDLGTIAENIKVDIVLAPFADVTMVRANLRSASTAPVVLPVLDPGKKTEKNTCKLQALFCDLKLTDAIDLTVNVNDAMKKRNKALSAKK